MGQNNPKTGIFGFGSLVQIKLNAWLKVQLVGCDKLLSSTSWFWFGFDHLSNGVKCGC